MFAYCSRGLFGGIEDGSQARGSINRLGRKPQYEHNRNFDFA